MKQEHKKELTLSIATVLGQLKSLPSIQAGIEEDTALAGSLSDLVAVTKSIMQIDIDPKAEAHFNQLTPGETERLVKIIEEAAEVQKIACKTLVHGFESYSPLDPEKKTNRTKLAEEIGDATCWIELAIENGDIDQNVISEAADKKASVLKNYTHHQ